MRFMVEELDAYRYDSVDKMSDPSQMGRREESGRTTPGSEVTLGGGRNHAQDLTSTSARSCTPMSCYQWHDHVPMDDDFSSGCSSREKVLGMKCLSVVSRCGSRGAGTMYLVSPSPTVVFVCVLTVCTESFARCYVFCCSPDLVSLHGVRAFHVSSKKKKTRVRCGCGGCCCCLCFVWLVVWCSCRGVVCSCLR